MHTYDRYTNVCVCAIFRFAPWVIHWFEGAKDPFISKRTALIGFWLIPDHLHYPLLRLQSTHEKNLKSWNGDSQA